MLFHYPARMSSLDAKESLGIERFSAQLAQSIINQLIREIAFLHSENIAHGDM